MLRKTNGVTGEVTIVPSLETQRVRSVEEISREQHIKWLGKAKTAQFKDSGEMTVLPYGYLGQAITETLNQDRQHILEVLKEGVGTYLKERELELLTEIKRQGEGNQDPHTVTRVYEVRKVKDDILTLLQETLGEGKEI